MACVAMAGLPAAYAQDTTIPTPEATVMLPEPAYDTFFEPFTDNPVFRLQRPQPFTPPEPLFQRFNPLEGLDLRAKVSRLASTGRSVASLPILNARKGDRITVPVTFQGVRIMTAYTFRLNYNPAVLRATDVQKAGWTDSSLDFNIHPDRKTPESRIFIVQYSGSPWIPATPPVNIRFDVVGAGTSDLMIEDVDVSDDTFNTVPMVAHDGLVKVSE
jgi:hypothetical protein